MLSCVFLLGLALFYFLSEPFLLKAAEDEVLTRARIMMEGAAGIRKYTAEEVAPKLAPHMKKEFYPQTVAAYAATKNFDVLREGFPDYVYREASLNPTNPKARALEWEADIIHDFIAFPNKQDLVTYRDTPQGRYIHLARPLTVVEKCLPCHGRPDDAPKSLLAAYAGTTASVGS